VLVARRLLPAVLVAAAALADWQGAHGLARTTLLLALPFTAVAALTSLGDYLDSRWDGAALLHALLWGVAVVLLVLSCAVRRHTLHAVPPLAVSSVVACLGIFAVKATLVAAPHLRRAADLRPAKP
jgi:hypothetical protein